MSSVPLPLFISYPLFLVSTTDATAPKACSTGTVRTVHPRFTTYGYCALTPGARSQRTYAAVNCTSLLGGAPYRNSASSDCLAGLPLVLSFPPPPEMLSPDGASLTSPPALQLWGDNDAVANSSAPLATGPLCSLSTPSGDGQRSMLCSLPGAVSLPPGYYQALAVGSNVFAELPVLLLLEFTALDTVLSLMPSSPLGSRGPLALLNLSCAGASPGARSVSFQFDISCSGKPLLSGVTTLSPLMMSFSGVTDGPCSATVFCVENASSADPSPATVDWVLDFTSPNTTLLSAPPPLSRWSHASFVLGCSQAGGACGYRWALDGGTWVAVGQVASPGNGGSSGSLLSGLLPPTFMIIVSVTAFRDGSWVLGTSAVGSAPSLLLTPSAHLSVQLTPDPSLGAGASQAEGMQVEYRLTPAGSPVAPWTALPAGVSSLLLPSLTDGAYVLDARVAGFAEGGGRHLTVSLQFRVSSAAPEGRTAAVPLAFDTGSGKELALNWTVASSDDSASSVVVSVNGGAWTRLAGSVASLSSLANFSADSEAASLVVSARVEDAAGNVDVNAKTVVLPRTAMSPLLALQSPPLASTAGVGVDLVLTGAGSGRYMWRLDGGAWTVEVNSPRISATPSAPGWHVWEAVALDAGWTGPPLKHCWMVTPVDGRSPDVVSLVGLQDGRHRLDAQASDAAGNIDPGNASWMWVIDTVPPNGTCDISLVTGGCGVCARQINSSFFPPRSGKPRS